MTTFICTPATSRAKCNRESEMESASQCQSGAECLVKYRKQLTQRLRSMKLLLERVRRALYRLMLVKYFIVVRMN